jgi:hypothetical protein
VRNRLPNAIHVFKNIHVSHAKHAPARIFEERGALRVMLQLFGHPVRRTVHLDYETRTNARKVGDVRPNGVLTAKLATIQCATTKERPKHHFGFRHLLPETTRELARTRLSSSHRATPSVTALRAATAPP